MVTMDSDRRPLAIAHDRLFLEAGRFFLTNPYYLHGIVLRKWNSTAPGSHNEFHPNYHLYHLPTNCQQEQ